MHAIQIVEQCYRSSWSNPCPSLCNGEFVLVSTNFLSNQPPLNSNPGRNLNFISKFVENWRKFQLAKLFLTSKSFTMNFPDIFLSLEASVWEQIKFELIWISI
jgi:hypothetical protein